MTPGVYPCWIELRILEILLFIYPFLYLSIWYFFLSLSIWYFFLSLSIYPFLYLSIWYFCKFLSHILFQNCLIYFYIVVHLSFRFRYTIEFSFSIMEGPVSYILLDFIPVTFEFPFFYQYRLNILQLYHKSVVIFICLFITLVHYAFFLTTFTG